MLSSGTLNLKFMQRNNHLKNPNQQNSIKPITTKIDLTNSSSSPISIALDSKETQYSTQATLQQTCDLKKRKRQPSNSALNIIFEESLMSFPLLSFFRSEAAYPCNSGVLPVYTGRKSYGEFNKAIQKLDDTLITNDHAEPEGSTSQQVTKKETKKKSKTRQREDGQQGESSRVTTDQRTIRAEANRQRHVSTSTKVEKVETINISDDEKPKGFRKPLQTTVIKTKRKQIDLTKTDDQASSRPTASSSLPSKRSRQLNFQSTTQQSEPVVIQDDQSLNSDDSERVNQQIEKMFKEAKKSQLG